MRALRAAELPWVAARKETAKRKAMLGVSVNPQVCRKEEVWIANGKMGWRPAQREPACGRRNAWIATIAKQCGKEVVRADHGLENVM
jgi:hypothetical protein